MSWATQELSGVDLGDVRRDSRLWRIAEKLAQCAEQSVPQGFGSWAEVKAAYRFWENDHIDWRDILAPHRVSTARRAGEHEVVLVAQDTTEVSLTSHPATEGLGYLASSKARGVLLHTCLAISRRRVPLGVIDQQMWVRPVEDLGKTKDRRQKATADKESERWLAGLRATEQALANHPQVILIGDRESDIYDLFAAPRAPHVDLLVRVAWEGRRVDHPAKYIDRALAEAPAGGQVEIDVPRSKGRAPRRAPLNITWLTLTIRPPKHRPQSLPGVSLQFVLAEEVNPPAGEKPIRWVLATTLPVENLAAAVRCVEDYALRWLIERFHYTLKSGYQIEERLFAYRENIERAAVTLSIVAWRVLWLTYQARTEPNLPCTVILSEVEWQALHAAAHRRRPQPLPSQPLSLGEAVKMIGALGGHLGRKHDGPPGVKTVWRGLTRLSDITTGWLLAHPSPTATHLVGNG